MKTAQFAFLLVLANMVGLNMAAIAAQPRDTGEALEAVQAVTVERDEEVEAHVYFVTHRA